MLTRLLPFAAALLGGGAGGGAAMALGVPGGWLIGALAGVCLLAAVGAPVAIPVRVRSVAMGFAGLTVGGAVNGATLRAASILPWSLAAMFLALTVTLCASVVVHRRLGRSSPATAVAAAWPGHLLLALAGAQALHADLERVSIVQTFRLLALVVILPLSVGAGHTGGAAAGTMLSWDLAVAVLLAAACTAAAMRWRIVGGEMFLSAIAVGALVGTDMLSFQVPPAAGAFFQVVVGAYVGIGLARCRRQTLRVAFAAAVSAALVAALVTLAVALVASLLLDQPVAVLALAYAPGGAEAMILLSAAFQVDPGIVGIHHTVRLLALTLLFPLVLRRLARSAYQETGSR